MIGISFSTLGKSIPLLSRLHGKFIALGLYLPSGNPATAKDLASPGSTEGSGCLTSTTRSFDPALDTKSLSSEGVATPALVAMVRVAEVEVDRYVGNGE